MVQGFELAPPQQPLYRPVFHLGKGETRGGMAFVVEHAKKTYLISAQQWLGVYGGMARDYYGDDMKKYYKGGEFYPIFSGFKPVKTKRYLPIIEAQPATNGVEMAAYDIFAAPLTSVDSKPFKLAKHLPDHGEEVVVYVETADEGKLFYVAKVVKLDGSKEELTYEFSDNAILELIAGGAPVLNSKLEVVGMHVGVASIVERGRFMLQEKETGRVVGVANPSSAIRDHLSNHTE